MGASGWTHLNVKEIRAETDKAFRVRLQPTDDEPVGKLLWIPMAVIADPEDYDEGDENCTISVEDWWAIKNNLEGDD